MFLRKGFEDLGNLEQLVALRQYLVDDLMDHDNADDLTEDLKCQLIQTIALLSIAIPRENLENLPS